MDRKLALTIANAPTAAIAGEFFRHVSPSIDHLQANTFGGRWVHLAPTQFSTSAGPRTASS